MAMHMMYVPHMNGNIFMRHIYGKQKSWWKNLKPRREYKKFLKSLKSVSPDFSMLWNIADFIKELELVYMYDNSTKHDGLYSSNGYNPGENGIKYTSDDLSFVIKLFSDDTRVVIEIDRHKGNQIRGKLEFIGNDWVGDHDICDEMLLENIVNRLMNETTYLLTYFYDHRFTSVSVFDVFIEYTNHINKLKSFNQQY